LNDYSFEKALRGINYYMLVLLFKTRKIHLFLDISTSGVL
jgi:hypothetical protein